MGVGGALVRADRRGRVADAAAGAARRARRARERAAGRGAGRRRSRARRARERAGFWYRHSQRVMRRPVPVAVAAAAAADRARAAVPADRVHRRRRVACCRSEQTARMVDDAIATEFPPERDLAGATSWPASGARAPAQVRAPARGARRRRGVEPAARRRAATGSRSRAGDAALSDSAKDFVRDVRAVDAPFAVPVGGADRAASSTSRRRCARSCRSRWRSSRTTTLVILFVDDAARSCCR